jgi:hypothetical protein
MRDARNVLGERIFDFEKFPPRVRPAMLEANVARGLGDGNVRAESVAHQDSTKPIEELLCSVSTARFVHRVVNRVVRGENPSVPLAGLLLLAVHGPARFISAENSLDKHVRVQLFVCWLELLRDG